ncbi:MAG: hypothetical protein ACREDS_04585, partial [Limisphaerales bacterium]
MLGLLFGIGTTFLIVLLHSLITPPRYFANAVFSVNWDQMPIDLENQNDEQERLKTQKEIIARLTNPTIDDDFASQLCAACDISNTQLTATIIRQHLNVSLTGTTNNSGWFLVQFKDNDTNIALKVVNYICNKDVDEVNGKVKVKSGEQALQSLQENEDSQETEEELRDKLTDLLQQQDQEYDPDRQVQIQEIREKLDDLDSDKFQSGFNMGINGIDFFLEEPAKVEQDGSIQKRSTAYASSILPIAIIAGLGACIAGIF